MREADARRAQARHSSMAASLCSHAPQCSHAVHWYGLRIPRNAVPCMGVHALGRGADLAGVDHLLQSARGHQAVHVHVAALPDAERPVLGLQVVGGVPAGVHNHHPAHAMISAM